MAIVKINRYGCGFLLRTNCDDNPLDTAAILLYELRRHRVFMARKVGVDFFLPHELIWIQFSHCGIPFTRGLLNCISNT
jgi:hypothetical protein